MQLDLMDWLSSQPRSEGDSPRLTLVSTRRSVRRPKTPANALDQLELLLQGWDEETFTWTEDDVETLREALLRDALQTILDGRASADNRKSLWGWMMSDSIEPFSFRTCCEAVEVQWEEMRETFVSLARRHSKHSDTLRAIARH